MTYEAFEKIEANPSLILDEEFMFNIYKPISDRVKSFAEFMQYKFEELTCFPFGSRSPLEKILPFDLLRAELFYPTCSANIQSTDMTTEIAGEMAQAMKLDMADKRKATLLYILDGVKSMSKVTEEERQARMGWHANNSIAEAAHAHSTSNIQQFPMIRL